MSVHHAAAGECHQRDFLLFARFEARSRAGSDIQPHAAGLGAIEVQRRVDLEEVIMAAHLNGPVAGVFDQKRHSLPACIGGYRFPFE